ncbi:Regulatory protein PchR [compost metagenome]
MTNVSLRALQEGFRRFMGMSIVAYQRQVRLERAHDLLCWDTSSSVTDVALQYGFSNVGRFCQYFQAAYGVSPSDVRNGRRMRHSA